MRLGLLSDIHGNSLALDTCLRVLERERMDELIFIGDAVGYLPMALKVLTRLNESKAICLLGNHEAMLLDRLSLEPEQDEVYGLKMTRRELPNELIEQITHWPSKKTKILDSKRLLFVHGSPWDQLTGYIYPNDNLTRFSKLDVDAVFMGHTHLPFIDTIGKTLVVNIGSCGLPRDHGCLSSCAIYDVDTGDCCILRVPFDIQSVLKMASRPVHPDVVSCFARREKEKPFGTVVK